jgi:hypothetical protein
MKPHVFRAPIGRTGILRSIIVPGKIVSALGGAARIPVIARYAGETTKSTLVPAGGMKRRLVLQMDVLRPAKLDSGDTLEVALTADTGPRRPTFPPDLQRALQFRPAAAAELERESPSTWRMVIESLESSRTPESRQRRLEKIIEHLAENAANRARKK